MLVFVLRIFKNHAKGTQNESQILLRDYSITDFIFAKILYR